MRSIAQSVRCLGASRLEVIYADGLVAVLDFSEFLAAHTGPVIDPLRDPTIFATARLEDGVATWATGFDICPDVLRFWCEQGRVCSDRETDAHFESLRSFSAS